MPPSLHASLQTVKRLYKGSPVSSLRFPPVGSVFQPEGQMYFLTASLETLLSCKICEPGIRIASPVNSGYGTLAVTVAVPRRKELLLRLAQIAYPMRVRMLLLTS
jgi:hypothetical protein